ncbi:MAG TPA: glycosyltransferase [Polyangia bacterium]
MRLALFSHSLRSDWNHGNAHFLRGVVTELCARGHEVRCYEPSDAWSVQNLIAEAGEGALARAAEIYPALDIHPYRLAGVDDAWLDRALDGVELVLVHEWNDPGLVARLGRHRASRGYRILFHDTHHRSVSRPSEMAAYDLSRYDGVLAFGKVIRELYLANRWARRVWTWHEAADVRIFHPVEKSPGARGDLVFIGNWGDDERARELDEFLIEPVRALGLRARVHGVRYPDLARQKLAAAQIDYRGWIANFDVPSVFAAHRVTVHVPRRQYATQLPGIPTIRPFEAMASGIPLVCAPWDDVEGLFTPGEDFLVAHDGAEMRRHLGALLAEPARAVAMAERARRTILARHTCAHRTDELYAISRELDLQPERTGWAAA